VPDAVFSYPQFGVADISKRTYPVHRAETQSSGSSVLIGLAIFCPVILLMSGMLLDHRASRR
jgi:hypothetical protein